MSLILDKTKATNSILFLCLGVFGQDYAASNANRVAGILLWGSYLTGANRDLASYPVPVAHISGELDGLTRVTRFIDTYRYVCDVF